MGGVIKNVESDTKWWEGDKMVATSEIDTYMI